MAVSSDVTIVPRWVTPEEIKAGIKDRYSPKQAAILAEFKKAPELSSENIGEHLATQFTDYGLAAIKVPEITQHREDAFRISKTYGSAEKRTEMTEIAKNSPAIDFFPPVGEASRTIILANRKIKDEAVSTAGIDPEDRKVLADTFSVLENVGLSVVDHLGKWFGDDELTPFRESLNDSMQTKLGLNHLTALAKTEEKAEPKANNETTIRPHYDYGALTILTKGSRDGLEFYYDDKKKPEDSGWVRLKGLPENVVLAQAGQMLDIVTRGEFSPMLHQVKPDVTDKDKERDSLVLFMQPRETENLDKLKIKSSPNQISGFEARFKEFVSEATEFTSKNFSLFMNFMRRMRAVTEEFENFFKPDKLQEVIKNYQDHGLDNKVDPAFLRNEEASAK
ncbi:MAG: 2OG-Fe(II) oxygenase family protein [Candidatus Melainabacteria bacterium]|nr:2OG-Fe(II) oxygenase family protein [Candidatus Melainabacteria bacterium]